MNEYHLLSFIAYSWLCQSIGSPSPCSLNRLFIRYLKSKFRSGSVTLADEGDTNPKVCILACQCIACNREKAGKPLVDSAKEYVGRTQVVRCNRLLLRCEYLFSTLP